jgi:hypothetical protein
MGLLYGNQYFWAALALQTTSLGAFLAGFITTFWLNVPILRLHFGLWVICSDVICYTIDAFLGVPGGNRVVSCVCVRGWGVVCVCVCVFMCVCVCVRVGVC